MNTIVAMKAALACGSIHQGPFIFYGVGGRAAVSGRGHPKILELKGGSIPNIEGEGGFMQVYVLV